MTGIQTGTNWKFMLQRCPLIYGLRYKRYFARGMAMRYGWIDRIMVNCERFYETGGYGSPPVQEVNGLGSAVNGDGSAVDDGCVIGSEEADHFGDIGGGYPSVVFFVGHGFSVGGGVHNTRHNGVDIHP